MKLQDQLDAFKADFEAGNLSFNLPSAVHRLLHSANEELIASGAEKAALSVGDIAPDFVLQDTQGNRVSSEQLLAEGPLIVSFYRGWWCPYCNLDLQTLQAAMPELQRYSASVVAVSPQLPANGRKMQQDNDLAFPILADIGNLLAARFGLRFALTAELIELYSNSFNLDLAALNGDGSWTLPMPARFVIAPTKEIVFAQVSADYTRRSEPLALIPVLQSLK
ncbi:peroxiredoxin-like family protein [Serratia aquatilis]|uniref:thioredoxin-dependent peroxiredoxin n=1 Tax=Serratia aquatilis TaxID=1737515 RepID=A0ABV6EDD6_9GAMM